MFRISVSKCMTCYYGNNNEMLSKSMIVRSNNNNILAPQQHSLQEATQMTSTYSRLPENTRSIPASPDKSVCEVQRT